MAVDRLEALLKVLTVVSEWELTPQEHKALVERFAGLLQLHWLLCGDYSPPSSSARGGATSRLAPALYKDSAAPESRCARPN